MRLRKRSRGLTLVECLIAAGVLAIAALAITAAVTSGHMQACHAIHAQRATKLAEELSEFIVAMPYSDPDGASAPGPEADEFAVTDFDNMDDFHGYSEAPGGLKDVAGDLFPSEYQVFRRTVAAQYGTESVAGLGDPIPGLTVTVTVEDPKGLTWEVKRFIPEPP